MNKKIDNESLFKILKREIEQIEGVSRCGSFLEQFFVFLEKDTPKLRKNILKVVDDRIPVTHIRILNTGKVPTVSQRLSQRKTTWSSTKLRKSSY